MRVKEVGRQFRGTELERTLTCHPSFCRVVSLHWKAGDTIDLSSKPNSRLNQFYFFQYWSLVYALDINVILMFYFVSDLVLTLETLVLFCIFHLNGLFILKANITIQLGTFTNLQSNFFKMQNNVYEMLSVTILQMQTRKKKTCDMSLKMGQNRCTLLLIMYERKRSKRTKSANNMQLKGQKKQRKASSSYIDMSFRTKDTCLHMLKSFQVGVLDKNFYVISLSCNQVCCKQTSDYCFKLFGIWSNYITD